MCGIAVAIDWPDAESTVRSMILGILHRGDVSDPVVSPRPDTAMGTRRLRIVDADHAVQPQASFDSRILVSFNGEIYNHAELRRDLETQGISFKTQSDTEVIASALQVWGPAALKRFNGMFALVALDLATGEFLAARDPLGVKPLYFIRSRRGILFCSEIRPLLNATETGDVMLVPGGYMMSAGFFGAYQSSLGTIAPSSPQGDVRQLDRLLEEAVRIRLPPDLPVASMFSGGIDSTLVTHYARKFDANIPGYFLGGVEAPDYEHAACYADMTGLDLRMVQLGLNGKSGMDTIRAVVGCAEAFEPEVIRSGICSHEVARQMHADGFRVALCGEGADELFCGYLPLELVFAESTAWGNSVRGQCLSHMNRTNLQRVDRCSMQFQIETREPFLDPAVIVHALSLEGSALVNEIGGRPRGKMPLRALYDLYPEQLPASIRDRAKVPFNEGAGIDRGQCDSPWLAIAEATVSDKAFEDGKRRYKAFSLTGKEELLYLDALAETMDVDRVPHLKVRTHLVYPNISRMEELRPYVLAS